MAKSLKIIALAGLLLVALPAAAEEAAADPLDLLSGIDDVEVRLQFPGVSARIPFESLTVATHNQLELGPCVEQVVVDLRYDEMTVKQALRRLAREYGFRYTVPAHDKLIVDLARKRPVSGECPQAPAKKSDE